MTLNEYQTAALQTAIYPNVGRNILYPTLKLAGEAGEVAEQLGKAIRDDGFTGTDADELEPFRRVSMLKELSDVQWYVAAISHELGVTLEDLAAMNLRKLADRQSRGKLSGSGDER